MRLKCYLIHKKKGGAGQGGEKKNGRGGRRGLWKENGT